MIYSVIIRLAKNPWSWVVLLLLVLIIVIKVKGFSLFDFFKHAASSTDVVLTSEEKISAQQMATALHEEMSGLNLNRNIAPWRQFMRLSERMQRGTYQEFSNKYAAENRGTLLQWVSDEGSRFPSWNDAEGVASRAQVLERLNTLNLL